MSTLVIASDKSGCGYYRCVLPVQAAQAAGEDVSIDYGFNCAAEIAPNGETKIYNLHIPDGVDVISIQRPITNKIFSVIKWLREYRPDIGVVVELDDDLAAIKPNHDAFRAVAPHLSPGENWHFLFDAVSEADVLTVSTPALAERYGRKTPAHIVYNAIDPAAIDAALSAANGVLPATPEGPPGRLQARGRLDPAQELTIGWSGSIGAHPDDFEVGAPGILGAMRALNAAGRPTRLRIIGPSDGATRAFGGPRAIEGLSISASGWCKYDVYLQEMAKLDIGIVPLEDNRFNKSKSWLKAMEMSALGVPVVASGTDENRALSRSGVPIFVVRNRPRDWQRAISYLLNDDKERQSRAEFAHDVVMQNHTIQRQLPYWLKAWDAAREIAKRRDRVTDRARCRV